MLKLISNIVAIQGIQDADKSPGGLWIPDVAKERCDQGIVKYVGPLVKDVKPGDYVLFGGYDGVTVRLEGEGFLILIREPLIKCRIADLDTDVPGLYFRGKKSPEFDIGLDLILRQYTHEWDEAKADIIKLIALHDPYFPATFEMATQLISQAFSEGKHMRVKENVEDRSKSPNDGVPDEEDE